MPNQNSSPSLSSVLNLLVYAIICAGGILGYHFGLIDVSLESLIVGGSLVHLGLTSLASNSMVTPLVNSLQQNGQMLQANVQGQQNLQQVLATSIATHQATQQLLQANSAATAANTVAIYNTSPDNQVTATPPKVPAVSASASQSNASTS